MKTKVLVTGGAGFLGSHLCEWLINNNHDVLCIDNYSTGSKDNIENLLKNPFFEAIRHEVTLPFYSEIDQIYNLACPASPIHYQKDPSQTTTKRTNARILQASTSEVYGDPEVHPQTEDYWGRVNPIGIRSCYDEGKRCAETLFFDYYRQYNVDIKVARIFNTYGPKMNPFDGRVVSNFIVQALKGEDITIYGDGDQTRSFCYVDDLIRGITKFMNSTSDINGPMNLGNNSEFTMIELAEKVLKLTESKSKLIFKPLPLDDPRQRQPNLNKAKIELDWEPSVSLDDGLKETINYFKKIVR